MDFDDVELVAGRRCSLSSGGYVKCHGKYLHRLIMNCENNDRVDHINGIRTDNRRANLRLASNAENMWNRGKASHNTSGFKGVSFCTHTQKWRAEIRCNGKVVRLGRFVNAEDAAHAYDKAAVEFHGDFATTNFPRSPHMPVIETGIPL